MYEELILRLRRYLDDDEVSEDLRYAADAIEHLCEACGTAYNELANVHEDLEQTKLELAAALDDLKAKPMCEYCRHLVITRDGYREDWDCPYSGSCGRKRVKWEWRGIKGGPENETE